MVSVQYKAAQKDMLFLGNFSPQMDEGMRLFILQYISLTLKINRYQDNKLHVGQLPK